MRKPKLLMMSLALLLACGSPNPETAATAVETTAAVAEEAPAPRRNISCATVGHITLGMPLSTFREKMWQMHYLIEEKPVNEYGIDGEGTGFLVKDQEDALFFVWSKYQDIVGGIVVLSPLYQTDRGLHIGMEVAEVKKLYPEVMVGKSEMGEGVEQFMLPSCSPDKATVVYLAANDKKLLGEYQEPEKNKIPITGLREEGVVKGISVVAN